MNMQSLDVPLRAAIGAPLPVTWVESGDMRLAAMRRGTGTPVLCLHAIGHGERTEMSTADALTIAANATPLTEELSDPDDPNGRKPGDKVEVMPDDYGKVRVSGEIVALSAQHIAIRRHDPRAGEVVVHFPRAGFLVFPAA